MPRANFDYWLFIFGRASSAEFDAPCVGSGVF